MRISLLRHGKTQVDGIYRGHSDVALTPHGLAQMQQAYDGFSTPVDYLVSSHLQRCAHFSEQIPPTHKLDERFQEMSFGDWDGKLRAEIWRTQQAAVTAFWDNPMQGSAPNGESVEQVQTRAMAALHEHVKSALAQQCKHLLVVTHGGVIRAILGSILHMQPKGLFNLAVPYGGVANLNVACFNNKHGEHDYHLSVDFSSAQDML
ncbi:MAG: histidine phosphatase family protein [Gammaproteobacteria bacterium]|nr:histidine phosphatase family protein [Gammaproteobacteria bacterium]